MTELLQAVTPVDKTNSPPTSGTLVARLPQTRNSLAIETVPLNRLTKEVLATLDDQQKETLKQRLQRDAQNPDTALAKKITTLSELKEKQIINKHAYDLLVQKLTKPDGFTGETLGSWVPLER